MTEPVAIVADLKGKVVLITGDAAGGNRQDRVHIGPGKPCCIQKRRIAELDFLTALSARQSGQNCRDSLTQHIMQDPYFRQKQPLTLLTRCGSTQR